MAIAERTPEPTHIEEEIKEPEPVVEIEVEEKEETYEDIGPKF